MLSFDYQKVGGLINLCCLKLPVVLLICLLVIEVSAGFQTHVDVSRNDAYYAGLCNLLLTWAQFEILVANVFLQFVILSHEVVYKENHSIQ